MIESAVLWLLDLLSIPEVGLTSVFFVSLISATLLPMGSEPVVFATVKANAALFWPVILVATAGNTIGGVINYWVGFGAKHVLKGHEDPRWLAWFARYGAKTMVLAWLPAVGDPLCSLGGWARLPFWPCVFYMALGKFIRYVGMTSVLLFIPDGFWKFVGDLLI